MRHGSKFIDGVAIGVCLVYAITGHADRWWAGCIGGLGLALMVADTVAFVRGYRVKP